jgi:hypothetical protein
MGVSPFFLGWFYGQARYGFSQKKEYTLFYLF